MMAKVSLYCALPDQIEQALGELGPAGSLIAESFVTFSREVSIIAVRGQKMVKLKLGPWQKTIITTVFYRTRLYLHQTAQTSACGARLHHSPTQSLKLCGCTNT